MKFSSNRNKNILKPKIIKMKNKINNKDSNIKMVDSKIEWEKNVKNSNKNNILSKDIINYLISFKSQNEEFFKKFYVSQTEIKMSMRKILIQWIINVNFKFKLGFKNLFLALNLIDAYIQRKFISKEKLQLLGITCLYIATKFEQINPPNIKYFIYLCSNMYTKDDLIEMESKILLILNYNLNYNITFELLTNLKNIYCMSDQEYYLCLMIYLRNIYESKCFDVNPNEYTTSLIVISFITFNKNSLCDKFSKIYHYNLKIKQIVNETFDNLKLVDEDVITVMFSKIEFKEVGTINFNLINF